MVGLLDGRRPLSQPALQFAPVSTDSRGALVLRPFYRGVVKGRRVLLVDDVRNTGKTFERAKTLIEDEGGTVIATVQICDRLEGSWIWQTSLGIRRRKTPALLCAAGRFECSGPAPLAHFRAGVLHLPQSH
jgi:hypothetical protein